MNILKTNKSKFFTWLFLGVVGYLVGFFVVRPMLNGWTVSYNFSDDLLYNIFKLLVAEILILPAIIIAIWGLINSLKSKQFAWVLVHTLGVIVLAFVIFSFAMPILSPARGL